MEIAKAIFVKSGSGKSFPIILSEIATRTTSDGQDVKCSALLLIMVEDQDKVMLTYLDKFSKPEVRECSVPGISNLLRIKAGLRQIPLNIDPNWIEDGYSSYINEKTGETKYNVRLTSAGIADVAEQFSVSLGKYITDNGLAPKEKNAKAKA